MLIDWLLELKENIDKHGIRWGLALTLFAVYRKERRNLRLDNRDEALFHNQKIIMDQLGVGEQWHGPPKKSKLEDPQSYAKLFSSSRKAIHRGNPLNQRRIHMNNQQTNWVTLVPALLGLLKLILQPFGIDLSKITDDQVNAVINGAAALIAVWGVFKSHTKTPTTDQTQQPNSKNFIQG
jgi:phi LC3 family holin